MPSHNHIKEAGPVFARIRRRSIWLGVLAVPALLLAASPPAAAAVGARPAAPAVAAATSTCSPVPLGRSHFPAVPRIDNRFYPLTPGTQFFLDGFVVADDGTKHPHRIATTVTDLTKVIDGVRTVVVFDVDIQDGRLQESELFFVAQRSDGSVWTLGEYPEEYDNGTLTGAPSTWISGIAGARAGRAMLANPQVGTPTYQQGLAPKVGFDDCATVFQTGQQACVPVGCFNDVLVVDEFAPNDPTGGHQRKLYAPGLGTIRVEPVGGTGQEALKLTKAAPLCPSEFAAVRTQVLAQDRRGYHVSPDVYAKTPHAERTLYATTC
jgi:hypothetical protein